MHFSALQAACVRIKWPCLIKRLCFNTVMMSKRAFKTRSRSSTTQVRINCYSIHPGRPCQPCILCKTSNLLKYFHPKSWKDKTLLENLRKCEPSVVVQLDNCVCRLCQDDISMLCDDAFVPRWNRLKMSTELQK